MRQFIIESFLDGQDPDTIKQSLFNLRRAIHEQTDAYSTALKAWEADPSHETDDACRAAYNDMHAAAQAYQMALEFAVLRWPESSWVDYGCLPWARS